MKRLDLFAMTSSVTFSHHARSTPSHSYILLDPPSSFLFLLYLSPFTPSAFSISSRCRLPLSSWKVRCWYKSWSLWTRKHPSSTVYLHLSSPSRPFTLFTHISCLLAPQLPITQTHPFLALLRRHMLISSVEYNSAINQYFHVSPFTVSLLTFSPTPSCIPRLSVLAVLPLSRSGPIFKEL